MFSTGQIIFALLFTIAFIPIIVLSYKKDKKTHSKNYKGVTWVAMAFVVFILILFVLKYFLN